MVVKRGQTPASPTSCLTHKSHSGNDDHFKRTSLLVLFVSTGLSPVGCCSPVVVHTPRSRWPVPSCPPAGVWPCVAGARHLSCTLGGEGRGLCARPGGRGRARGGPYRPRGAKLARLGRFDSTIQLSHSFAQGAVLRCVQIPWSPYSPPFHFHHHRLTVITCRPSILADRGCTHWVSSANNTSYQPTCLIAS